MPVLTKPQYYKYRAEMEKLALLLDDDTTPDLEYCIAARRADLLQNLFVDHWKCFNAKGDKMDDREKVARALTSWMNGKKQEPKPDWDKLPEPVRVAYLEQADEAIAALGTAQH